MTGATLVPDISDAQAREAIAYARKHTGGTHLIEILLIARAQPGRITRDQMDDRDFAWTFEAARSTGLIEREHDIASRDVLVLLTPKGAGQLRLHWGAYMRRQTKRETGPAVEVPKPRATKRIIDLD